jgi:GNAT superfamily N-acetyltransferase
MGSDMLVSLYKLPPWEPEQKRMEALGVKIQKAFPPDRYQVIDWVRRYSGPYAAGEAACSFKDKGTTMYLAVREGAIVGYACYDATAPDFFGPTRVLDSEQGKGIGKALLLACLHAMREEGYGYAIIGDAGPTGFYEKCVGAVIIQGSTPGIYQDFLKLKDEE